MQIFQRAGKAVFGLSIAALIAFWTVKDTKPSGAAVFPILYGVLFVSALIWLLTGLLGRWVSRSHLDLRIDGVLMGETDFEALLQPTVRVSNGGTEEVVIHGWRATLKLTGQVHDLRHVYGQDRLRGSVDLPFLDRIGPLRPGLTPGLLQFSVPGVGERLVRESLDLSDAPLRFVVELMGRGRRRWKAEVDIRDLAAQRRATIPARDSSQT